MARTRKIKGSSLRLGDWLTGAGVSVDPKEVEGNVESIIVLGWTPHGGRYYDVTTTTKSGNRWQGVIEDSDRITVERN